MSIKVIGSYPKEVCRIQTGFWSLDHAFINDRKEVGLPVGHGYEIFGTTGTGKSTFTYSLAGVIAKHFSKNVVISDFEGFDRKFAVRLLEATGFDGTLNMVRKKEDEEQLDEMLKILAKDDYAVGVLDSIGAISPISEQSGDIGEANMGRRAMAMAQFSRKCLKIFRDGEDDGKLKTVLMINHWYPKIAANGYDTPGGEVKKYITTTRILLRKIIVNKNENTFPDGSYVLEGEVKKNRWGINGRKFYAAITASKGLDKEMTAVWDCIKTEKATRTKYISIGKNKIATMSELVKKSKENDLEIFNAFYEALNDTTTSIESSTDGDGGMEMDELQDESPDPEEE